MLCQTKYLQFGEPVLPLCVPEQHVRCSEPNGVAETSRTEYGLIWGDDLDGFNISIRLDGLSMRKAAEMFRDKLIEKTNELRSNIERRPGNINQIQFLILSPLHIGKNHSKYDPEYYSALQMYGALMAYQSQCPQGSETFRFENASFETFSDIYPLSDKDTMTLNFLSDLLFGPWA